MRIILCVLFTAINGVIFGQITTTKVAPKNEIIERTHYDSTKNFLGKQYYQYIGQELYLKGKYEGLQIYGYDNFVLDYTKEILGNSNNIYKCCQNHKSKYHELAGKYFKVLEVIEFNNKQELKYLYDNKTFFKLQEKESKDIVFFLYNNQFEHEFPFIVKGFFEKQKPLVVGKEFIFKNEVLRSSTDIETGNVVTIRTGQKWKCIDLTVEEKYYNLALIIENSLGEKTTISHESVFGTWGYGRVYSLTEMESYIYRFGEEDFYMILQGRIKIGMSKEMCRLSWGKPKDINETISLNKVTEQWVYKSNYLYFENGILITIQ